MTDKPVVYATREIPEAGLDRLAGHCDLHVWEGKTPPSKEHIERRLSELEADGLLCLLTDEIDAAVMDSTPNLRVISTFSVGYDHIDVDAARDRNIAVGHTPGVLTETTADLAWALLMSCARRIVEGHEYVVDGEWETWQPTLLLGPDVHDATLGIVGMGNIGAAVARRGAGFGMDVLYTSRNKKIETERSLAELGVDATHVDHDRLFAESDFVSIHVPLTEQTHHLVGESELQAMSDDAVLINTSRGEVVDSAALDRALEEGWIFNTGLDVTDPEPLPEDHPLQKHIGTDLIVTPHIGSASLQTRNKMADMTTKNLLAGLAGESLPNSAISDMSSQ
jgi:glyoxylate reductase